MTQDADLAQRLRAGRAIFTILAAVLAWQAVEAMLKPLAGAPSPWWSALQFALVVCMLAFVWHRKPSLPLGYLSLLLALGAFGYANFGDRWLAGTRDTIVTLVTILAGLVAAAAILLYAWTAIGLCRRAAYPRESGVPRLLAKEGGEVPAALAGRVQALEAAGFALRAAGHEAEGQVDSSLAYLVHDREGVVATATRFEGDSLDFEFTKLIVAPDPASGTRRSVADGTGPDLFPDPPGTVALVIPGRSVESLLGVVRGLNAGNGRTPPPSIEAFASDTKRMHDERLRWLVDRGFLRAQAVNDAHRFTLKGAFVATLRILWPGRAILRWMRRREALAAVDGRAR